jgi:hypothetical protein
MIKQKNHQHKPFPNLRSFLTYFPGRLLLVFPAVIFVLFKLGPIVEHLRGLILIVLFRLLRISIYQVGTALFIGPDPLQIKLIFVGEGKRLIFYGFFIAFALTMKDTSLWIRFKSLLFVAAYYFILTLAEFLFLLTILWFGFDSSVYYTVDLMLSFLLGLAFMEVMFFLLYLGFQSHLWSKQRLNEIEV